MIDFDRTVGKSLMFAFSGSSRPFRRRQLLAATAIALALPLCARADADRCWCRCEEPAAAYGGTEACE